MLEFTFWDVQHGSAAYIRTPNGKNIVIDLGTGSYGDSNISFSPLLHLKSKYGVTELDAVIITHPHRDHLDDILNFDKLSPGILSRPKHLTEYDIRSGNRDQDKAIIYKYLEINRRFNSPVGSSENPFLADNNGGVDIQKFTPTSCATTNLNNHSIVTVFNYAGLKMVVPGDNESSSWDEIMKLGDFRSATKNADILIAPHHGRDSGFSLPFVQHVNPRLTIISDGRFCDTSATGRYSHLTRGWTVYKRSNGSEKRNCVTTRNDGVIVTKFGRNSNGSNFIHVTID